MKRCIMAMLLAVATVACATNPVTGKSELSLVSESQEIEIGRQEAQKTVQSIGEYDNAAAQALVRQIGMRMASESERPNLPWEFHVLDDEQVNAFALPGGFIFVTRGIMTYMNDEAELASVIGHEIGHVTAKHSVSQMSNAAAGAGGTRRGHDGLAHGAGHGRAAAAGACSCSSSSSAGMTRRKRTCSASAT